MAFHIAPKGRAIVRVLFLEDVINVADAGEVKEVANGFARNYLLPKNLATVATPEQLKRIARLQRTAEERRVRETGDWRALARILEGTTLHIPGKVGPTGKFYGAISVTRIIEELEAATNQKVQRRSVELSEPIREPGNYPINLRLHQKVTAEIIVVAQTEGQEDYDAEEGDSQESEPTVDEVAVEAEAETAAR